MRSLGENLHKNFKIWIFKWGLFGDRITNSLKSGGLWEAEQYFMNKTMGPWVIDAENGGLDKLTYVSSPEWECPSNRIAISAYY